MIKNKSEKAEKLAKKLKRLIGPLSTLAVLLAIFLALIGLDPVLSAIIALAVACIPAFIIGIKIDRLLGFPLFKRVNVPRSELMKMILVGIANLTIFTMAFITSSTALALTGVLFFFFFTVPQGKRISRMSQESAKKKLPPQKRKLFEKVYTTLERSEESTKKDKD
jgi:hypothetical protein